MLRSRHVELHIAHAAVHKRDGVLHQPACRQAAQPCRRFGAQAAARAAERIARLVRAALEAQASRADQVVIAGDDARAARAQERDAGIRVGVIADDVADARELAGATRVECREHRLERLEVAVDVA